MNQKTDLETTPLTLRVKKINDLNARANYYLTALKKTLHFKLALANLLAGILPNFVSGVIRGRLYRLIGFKIEPGDFIMGNLNLVSGQDGFYDKLQIGSAAVIGDHVTINLDAEVIIGKNVSIGPHVLIYTGTHPIGPGSMRRLDKLVAKPVNIGDGSWVGLGAIVLPGVTIGKGCIIAAGAVVNQDVPPNSYFEGNPGRVTQQLPWGNR